MRVWSLPIIFIIISYVNIFYSISFTYHLIFYSFYPTDHGKIIKSVNAESADSAEKVTSVVIEEIDVLTKSEPIRNLEIVRTMQYGKGGIWMGLN